MRPASPLLGLAAFAGWIAVEILAFNLVARWTGGSLAFFLLVMKSVLGVLFVQRVVRQKIFQALRHGSIVLDGTDAAQAWLKGLGAALLVIPGFAAGLAGLALLTPSIRRAIAGRGAARQQNTREIDLVEGDWTEIPDPQKRQIRRRKSDTGA